MTLIFDDEENVYIWVDVDDFNKELSPKFLKEEDAITWYGTISAHIFNEFGIVENKK
jgi:hypothetical protein